MRCRLERVDHAILLLNLILLLCVGVVPFATSLIATYLDKPHGQSLAAGVYAGTFLLVTTVFVALNWHILFRKAHMLGVDLSHERRRDLVVRGLSGVLPYALATAIAYVSPFATLAICAAIAVFYATLLATGGPPSQP